MGNELNKLTEPLKVLIDKSLQEIKANSKAVEEALEKFLQEKGVEVSDSEYNELKRLTNTMDELDYALVKLSEAPVRKKPTRKKTKKKSTKKKTQRTK